MSNKTEEINKLSHALVEAEVRLRTVGVQIDGIDKEIALLNVVEANLEENIRQMKKKKMITIASIYKKSIEDLKTARNRRAMIRIDRQNCIKAQKKLQISFDKVKSDYEIALIMEDEQNVIQINFRRKYGQE